MSTFNPNKEFWFDVGALACLLFHCESDDDEAKRAYEGLVDEMNETLGGDIYPGWLYHRGWREMTDVVFPEVT